MRLLRRLREDRGGFTVLQFMLAIAVLGVVILLVGPRLMEFVDKANSNRSVEEARLLRDTLQMMAMEQASVHGGNEIYFAKEKNDGTQRDGHHYLTDAGWQYLRSMTTTYNQFEIDSPQIDTTWVLHRVHLDEKSGGLVRFGYYSSLSHYVVYEGGKLTVYAYPYTEDFPLG